MNHLRDFEALDEKYCASYKIADPPASVDVNNETEMLLWVYGDMERLLNQCRVRKFIIPFTEGGVVLSYEAFDDTDYESSSKLLTETQRDLYASILEDKKVLDKQRSKLVESRVILQEELESLDEEAAEDRDAQENQVIADKKAELKRGLRKIVKRLESIAEERIDRMKEIAEWEHKMSILCENHEKKSRKAYNTARAGVNKILEEYRELGRKFPVILNIMHGANNYSKTDPVHNADARGIYENVRRAIVPRGVLGRIAFLIQTLDKVNEMRKKTVQYLEIWNTVVAMKDMAIKLGWSGITLNELYAMISLQGLSRDMQVKFIQYVKVALLSRKAKSQEDESIMDIRSDNGDDDRTSIGDDSDVDYLSEIGTFLHDYIRESNQVSKMMSHNSNSVVNAPVNNGKKFGPGKFSRGKEAKEILTVQDESSNSIKTSGDNDGDNTGTDHSNRESKFHGGITGNNSRICYQYAAEGSCRRGDKCKFSHDPSSKVSIKKGNHNVGYVAVSLHQDSLIISKNYVKSHYGDDRVRVAIDSQSGVNLTTNKGLCEGIKPGDHRLHLSGIGGSIISEFEGSITVNGKPTRFSIIENKNGNNEIPTILSIGKYINEGGGEDNRYMFMSKHGGLRGTLGVNEFNEVYEVLKKSQVHGVSHLERDVFNEYWTIPAVHRNEVVEENALCELECDVDCDGDVILESEGKGGVREPGNGLNDEEMISEGLFDVIEDEEVNGIVFDSIYYVKFGCRPIYHDSVDEAVGYLAHCGLSREAISSIIENQTVDHFPRALSLKAVRDHFKDVGIPVEQELAQMTKARLAPSVKSERSCVDGEVIQLDGCEPDFSKIHGDGGRTIKSCGGFTKAVIAICEASGFCFVEGMKHNEAKHNVLNRIILEIKLKFPNVKKIRADSEWWSKECRELYLSHGLIYEASPTYDHRSTTGLVESTIRRMQDLGQLNMNNLLHYVEKKKISDVQRVKLWYHALHYARVIMLLYPSFNDEKRTRYEVGYKRKPDVNYIVIMPFGSAVVTRVQDSSMGRGALALYVGPSLALRGGINVFNISTKRIQSSWSYKPINMNNNTYDINVERVATNIFGNLEAIKETVVTDGGVTSINSSNKSDDVNGVKEKRSRVLDELPLKEYWSNSDVYFISEDESKWVEHQQVFTMECKAEDQKFSELERPLKPIIPKRHEIYRYPKWREAIRREVTKLFEAGTLKKRDYSVNPSVIMELIPVFEFKWKLDPVTGNMCWLECCRIVINGSTDTRQHENVYAETPDQTIVLTSLALSAKKGEEDRTSDAARAYLQAEQTEEGVVVTPCSVLKKNGLEDEQYDIGTALYGDRLAALQWQMKAERELLAVGCVKCLSTRSSYVKLLGEDEKYLIRIVRHSDDFLFSGINDECEGDFDKFISDLRSRIVMEQPKSVKHLLGYEIHRINEDGSDDKCGRLVLITMMAKIERLYLDYKELIDKWNMKHKLRKTPSHQDIIRMDSESSIDVLDMVLNVEDHSIYRSVLGKLMYISMSYRYDIRFTTFALALRSTKPRNWDLKCALWCVEYLHATKELPLVLGGELKLCATTFSDATLGTAYEGRSVRGHFFRLSERSGAVFASVHCLKCAVKSVFHPELASCADGVDTSLFMCNILQDFNVRDEVGKPVVFCDNEAVVKWLNGDKYNAKTRGLDTLYYSIRHLVQEDLVDVCHISGEDNPSDLLTKILPYDVHWKHTKNIMGLQLLSGIPKFEKLLDHDGYFNG